MPLDRYYKVPRSEEKLLNLRGKALNRPFKNCDVNEISCEIETTRIKRDEFENGFLVYRTVSNFSTNGNTREIASFVTPSREMQLGLHTSK